MITSPAMPKYSLITACVVSLLLQACTVVRVPNETRGDQFVDSHFHITGYAMQGVSLKTLIDRYMGKRVLRSTAMPIPLQQKWDPFEHFADDKMPPNYYLGPKASLYYYAFIDAQLALDYLELADYDQIRIDPMITGFDPMDNYAVQHIKRVLLNFPGVFSGIGEFTVHKEIVSDKIGADSIKSIAGEQTPPDVIDGGKLSLYSPALERVLNFAGETGLIAVLHSDLYPAKVSYDGKQAEVLPADPYLAGMKHLCAATPNTTLIWAHTGLGRFVKPPSDHLDKVAEILEACPNWSVDISWDLVQAYIVSPEAGMPSSEQWQDFIRRYADRVLWGSDHVIHSKNQLDAQGQAQLGDSMPVYDYQVVMDKTAALWKALGPVISDRVKVSNHLRLFDIARAKVRNWERLHAGEDVWNLPVDAAE